MSTLPPTPPPMPNPEMPGPEPDAASTAPNTGAFPPPNLSDMLVGKHADGTIKREGLSQEQIDALANAGHILEPESVAPEQPPALPESPATPETPAQPEQDKLTAADIARAFMKVMDFRDQNQAQQMHEQQRRLIESRSGQPTPPEPPDWLEGADPAELERYKPSITEDQPTMADLEAVFNQHGVQLGRPGREGEPEWVPYNRFNVRKIEGEMARLVKNHEVTMVDIYGMPIPFEERGDKIFLEKTRDRINGKIAKYIELRHNTEDADSDANRQNLERVLGITSNGADFKVRCLFAKEIRTRDANGKIHTEYWMHGQPKPLNTQQVAMYKQRLKMVKTNKPYAQAASSYEIGKLMETQQEGQLNSQGPEWGWNDMINTMWKDFRFTEHEITSVFTGNKFQKKLTYLTVKHRPLVHPPLYVTDQYGNTMREPVIDPRTGLQRISHITRKPMTQKVQQRDEHGKPLMDASRLVMGDLKRLEYSAELEEKLKQHEMQFSPYDLEVLLEHVEQSAAIMEDCYWNPTERMMREFRLHSTFIMKIGNAVQGTKMTMGGGLDPMAEGNLQQMQAMSQQGYEPRITGSAAALALWPKVGKLADREYALFPALGLPQRQDYHARDRDQDASFKRQELEYKLAHPNSGGHH